MAAPNYASKPLSERRNWWLDGVTGSIYPATRGGSTSGTGVPPRVQESRPHSAPDQRAWPVENPTLSIEGGDAAPAHQREGPRHDRPLPPSAATSASAECAWVLWVVEPTALENLRRRPARR